MSATGSRGAGRSAQAGFTLIESLTVLAITAAIGAMSFPSLERAVAAVALVQARQALVADLRRAQAQALSGGGPVDVTVSADGRGYGWSGGTIRTLPPTIRLRMDGDDAIAFFPDGSASTGALTLWSGTRGARIAVAPTGALAAESLPPQAASRP